MLETILGTSARRPLGDVVPDEQLDEGCQDTLPTNGAA
jgi:hypothetical protein